MVAGAGRLVIDVQTGVGVSNGLETTVASLDVDNATSGAIKIADTSALTVVKLVQATAGDISLSTEGTLTLNSGGTPSNVVSTLGTGTITLDANGVTSDIDVEDGISSASGTISLTADNDIDVQDGLSSTSGDISLTADNDILLNVADADISTTSGNVSLMADADNGGVESGAIVMADGALINAGSGTIALIADEDITVGGLTTTNNSNTAVSLTTREGGILDGGDTLVDVVAGAGRLVIDAHNGGG